MKKFEIFKPGRHTASSGATLDFSEDQLKAAVDAYDPALHEAPIVVGHPRDNGPAYGWIKSLSFADGAIVAEPQQLDAEFAEMVSAGRFKKRSASWYLPDSPNNPKPGTLYLRHVGFLGAQPPAVKGLKEVAFSDAEEGVVEFSQTGRWAFSSIADVMRNLREWLIADRGMEAADRVIPTYAIDSVTTAANEVDSDIQPSAMPAFSEGEQMTIEELKAQVQALTTERDALKSQVDESANFAERESALAAREAKVAEAEAAAARATIEARVEGIVKDGRMLPAQKKAAIDFAMGLAAGEATIDFGEGDKAEKLTQREAYLRQLEAAPKAVDYTERAPAGDAPPEGAKNPTEVAEKARDLVRKAKAEGKALSFTEAVSQVMTADAE